MAIKGRIQVISCGGDRGEFVVQGVDAATTQLLMQAIGDKDGLKVEAAWVRRRGGARMPELRVGIYAPKKSVTAAHGAKIGFALKLTDSDDAAVRGKEKAQ